MRPRKRKIKATNTKTGTVRTFDSVKEAANYLNASLGNVVSAARNRKLKENAKYVRTTVKGWQIDYMEDENYAQNVQPYQGHRKCEECDRMIAESMSTKRNLCPICYKRIVRKKIIFD